MSGKTNSDALEYQSALNKKTTDRNEEVDADKWEKLLSPVYHKI